MKRNEKVRVAIVGGGPAGLCAAYELLSKHPNDYDVTIYQMGWRVGGKGTSGYRRWTPPGTNQEVWNRIEEHGLHVLFGFYDSVFQVLGRVYADVPELPGAKDQAGFARFEDAFEPRDLGSIMHRRLSRWNAWSMSMPRNSRRVTEAQGGRIHDVQPGDRVHQVVGAALSMLRELLSIPYGDQKPMREDSLRFTVYQVIGRVAQRAVGGAYQKALAHPQPTQRVLAGLQRALHLFSRTSELTTTTYLAWHAADYFLAALRGAIHFQLRTFSDFEQDTLEALDYRDFLRQFGLHRRSMHGPLVGVIYHAAFSYSLGDPDLPAAAAGSALRLLIQAGWMYKGAAFYKMRGGMGDTVFAPMYRALKARGAKFEFFHRVTAYRLDERRQSVASVEIDVQAEPKEREYDPLILAGGAKKFWAFPSQPLLERLRAPAASVADTEHFFDSTVARKKELRAGRDFDLLIAATPIETLRHIAKELTAASAKWSDMVNNVTAVQTVSAQLWFDRSTRELGWKRPQCARADTLLSVYWKPISTFCPMDQTLHCESWGADEPKSVVYITGVHGGPKHAPTPQEDPHFDLKEQREARQLSLDFMRYFIAEDMLPGLENPESPPSPDWNRLFDADGGAGSMRFRAQYYRSNNDPSARCTLAEPDKTRFRLAAGDAQFENLVLAGDWIRNGVNCACMEGAFRSGLQAAAAVAELVERRRSEARAIALSANRPGA